MKKIFTSLLMMLMLIASQVLPTAALSYDESYTSAKGYYSQKQVSIVLVNYMLMKPLDWILVIILLII